MHGLAISCRSASLHIARPVFIVFIDKACTVIYIMHSVFILSGSLSILSVLKMIVLTLNV